jgi:hypothetical protein
MVTIRTYQPNGEDFPPSQGVYQAVLLREVLFHVRLSMRDRERQIGLFSGEGKCSGMWLHDAELGVEDGGYVLYRPGDMPIGMWNAYVGRFAGGRRGH